MRKWFLVLIMGALLVFPSFASAEKQIAIQTLNVNFWPEYDRAEMLVINYITLTPESIPAIFNLRIPASAGAVYTVAVGPSIDQVSDQDVKYTVAQQGEWLVVSVEASAPAIQIEYYDPGLKKNGKSRSYNYEWLSDYEVKNFGVVLQQPLGASGFKSSLPLQDNGIGANNLQYFISKVGALTAGKAFLFDVSYEKPSDTLSISQLKVEAIDPVNTDTAGRVSFSNYFPYIIGGIGVLLILGGGVYYFQSNKSDSKKTRHRARGKSDGEESGGDVYCAQCGTRAHGGDRFCRTCGSRIRQSEE